MKEYIDKNSLIEFLNNLKQSRQPITEGFDITIDDVIAIIMGIPDVDVIDRRKINKVIEEMKMHIKYNTDPKIGRTNLLGQGQMMMLNILEKCLESEERQ